MIFQNSFADLLLQGLTIDLKTVSLSMHIFNNLGIHHIQGKNYKKLKNTRALKINQKG